MKSRSRQILHCPPSTATLQPHPPSHRQGLPKTANSHRSASRVPRFAFLAATPAGAASGCPATQVPADAPTQQPTQTTPAEAQAENPQICGPNAAVEVEKTICQTSQLPPLNFTIFAQIRPESLFRPLIPILTLSPHPLVCKPERGFSDSSRSQDVSPVHLNPSPPPNTPRQHRPLLCRCMDRRSRSLCNHQRRRTNSPPLRLNHP